MIFDGHYKSGIEQFMEELSFFINEDLHKAFTVAKTWAQFNIGWRLQDETIDHAKAVVTVMAQWQMESDMSLALKTLPQDIQQQQQKKKNSKHGGSPPQWQCSQRKISLRTLPLEALFMAFPKTIRPLDNTTTHKAFHSFVQFLRTRYKNHPVTVLGNFPNWVLRVVLWFRMESSWTSFITIIR